MAEDEAQLGASARIEPRLLAEVTEHCRGPSPPNGDGGVRRRCRRAVCAVDRFATIPPFAIEQDASRGSDDGLHAAGLQQYSVDESAGGEARGAADRAGLVRARTARAIRIVPSPTRCWRTCSSATTDWREPSDLSAPRRTRSRCHERSSTNRHRRCGRVAHRRRIDSRRTDAGLRERHVGQRDCPRRTILGRGHHHGDADACRRDPYRSDDDIEVVSRQRRTRAARADDHGARGAGPFT